MDPKTGYRSSGWCPICEASVTFESQDGWYRDHLLCSGCSSIPRERALAAVLADRYPEWRSLRIHESSPIGRGISAKLKTECAEYIPTQFHPNRPLGDLVDGVRNEDLERQTFPDRSFDIVITLDVMEHVNEPSSVIREIYRTLRPSGAYIFTTPTYKGITSSQRRARILPSGDIEFHAEPEFHASPVDAAGSLVTFHYGYDLPQLIGSWSPFDTRVIRFDERRMGILGEFTEVYICVAN
jgi:SAM-dependent methyltransferase